MSQRIVIASNQAKHIQADIYYKNIVDYDDDRKVISEKDLSLR